MNVLLLSMLLSAPACEDGTLLYLEHGNRIVESQTESSFTHVAMIFNINNEPWVYEADSPRVRKVKLSDYIKEVQKINRRRKRQRKLWTLAPKESFTSEQSDSMKKYLDSQLGRKYGISSYITGEVERRIHCGELTARALKLGGVEVNGNPCTQTPIGLMKRVSKKYEGISEISIPKISHHNKRPATIVSKTEDLFAYSLQCVQDCSSSALCLSPW